MNFSCLLLQNIAFPPYNRLGSKRLSATVWEVFLSPRRNWNLSSHYSTEGWTVLVLFVFVSRSCKVKVKLSAITGNVFTLAFWLTECLCILYKVKPFFFEEFIIENPAHDTLHTRISEVWKNHKIIPTSGPALKQSKIKFDFLIGDANLTSVSSAFLFAFSGTKYYFGVRRMFLCQRFFQRIPFQIFKRTLIVMIQPKKNWRNLCA